MMYLLKLIELIIRLTQLVEALKKLMALLVAQ
jgi:hypothetical protein